MDNNTPTTCPNCVHNNGIKIAGFITNGVDTVFTPVFVTCSHTSEAEWAEIKASRNSDDKVMADAPVPLPRQRKKNPFTVVGGSEADKRPDWLKKLEDQNDAG
jgi:hypothetical protein